MIKIVKVFSKILYDKKYLKGRYFDENTTGWIWVLKGIWFNKVLGFNRTCPFPINPTIRISNIHNLEIGENNLNNFQSFGIYFQNFNAKIILGDEVYIAPNVGIITANHDFTQLSQHLEGKDVVIGNHSWIGMNAVILPGVVLGPNTVVGAGAVVTKSFTEGNIILAGNPAKIIKYLIPNEKDTYNSRC